MPPGQRPATLSLVFALPASPAADKPDCDESVRTLLGLLDGHQARATWSIPTPELVSTDVLETLTGDHDLAIDVRRLKSGVSRSQLATHLADQCGRWEGQGGRPAGMLLAEGAAIAHPDLLVKHQLNIICRPLPAPATQRRLTAWLWPTSVDVGRPQMVRWGLWQLRALDTNEWGPTAVCRAIDSAIASQQHLAVLIGLDGDLSERARKRLERILAHADSHLAYRRLAYATLGELPALLTPRRMSAPSHSVLRRAA